MHAGFICRSCLSRIASRRLLHHQASRSNGVASGNQQPWQRPLATNQKTHQTPNVSSVEPRSNVTRKDPARESGVVIRKVAPGASKAHRTRSPNQAGQSVPTSPLDSRKSPSKHRQSHIQPRPFVKTASYGSAPKQRRQKPIVEPTYAGDFETLDAASRRHFGLWRRSVREDALRVVREPGWRPDPASAPEVLRSLLGHGTTSAMTAAWNSAALSRRKSVWPELMTSALLSHPERALSVLEATLDPLPPGYALQDTIQFIALWHGSLPQAEATARANSLVDLVCKITRLIRNRSDTRVIFKQNTLYHLGLRASTEKLEDLFHAMMQHQQMHPYTLLQMARGFAKDPNRKELAIRVAISAAEAGGADLNSPQWSSLCTSILSTPPSHGDEEKINSAVNAFHRLLRHGFAPNIINFTALIRALCLHGHVRSAWDMVGILRSHEIEPDAVLLSILLDAAKNHTQSIEEIDLITTMAVEHRVLDTPLLNGLFSLILHYSMSVARQAEIKKQRRIPIFGPMLHFYSKIFHLEPLQRLIPVDLSSLASTSYTDLPHPLEKVNQLFPAVSRVAESVEEKRHPSGRTLAIMYAAYMRSISNPSSILAVYSCIRRAVRSGDDPVVAGLMRETNTWLYDVIVMRLCQQPGFLRASQDIIGDMLKDRLAREEEGEGEEKETSSAMSSHEGNASVENAEPPSPPAESKKKQGLHPAPSIHTWTILLNGLMEQREVAAGERLIVMMQEHGVKPTLPTWNTLIAGYARLRNLQGVMRSLQRLQNAGHEPNERTMQALSGYAGEESVLDLIEKAVSPSQAGPLESNENLLAFYAGEGYGGYVYEEARGEEAGG